MAIVNPFYTPEMQGAYRLHSLGTFELADGGVIPDLNLAVATFGELNEGKSNAILIPTWFSGTHQTWEQVYIGPGRALDPERYFIVVVNQIGNGLSTSPHNADGANSDIAMSRFPRVRIEDDVRAQERLLREEWGIEDLALVVGGSMGAQQTWEWAVRFPEKVRRAAPIAGTAQNTPTTSSLPRRSWRRSPPTPGGPVVSMRRAPMRWPGCAGTRISGRRWG